MSTALNSNALNVAVGLLLPAAVLGVDRASANISLLAWWYVGLTVLLLGLAYRGRGLRRLAGVAIIVGYGAFLAAVLRSASGARVTQSLVPALLMMAGGLTVAFWPDPSGRVVGTSWHPRQWAERTLRHVVARRSRHACEPWEGDEEEASPQSGEE